MRSGAVVIATSLLAQLCYTSWPLADEKIRRLQESVASEPVMQKQIRLKALSTRRKDPPLKGLAAWIKLISAIPK